jgi:2-dehydropantoate 2-reductase
MATITLIGPGAIGLSVGMALLDAGHDVTFVSRQPFDMLSLTMNTGEVRQRPVRVVTADKAPHAEWVFLCVKAHQVSSTAEALDRSIGQGTRIAVLQNGVEHVENTAPYVPETAVILPVMVDIPASKLGNGQAAWRRSANMVVENSVDGEAFRDLFKGTFVDVTLTDDMVTRLWRKLLVNAGAGAILCLSGKPMKVFHEPGIVELARGILHECLDVGRAEGAKLTEDMVEEQIASWVAAGPDDTNSMYDDFMAGRVTEWNARNGVLVRKAEKHGISTPISWVLVPLLAAQSRL